MAYQKFPAPLALLARAVAISVLALGLSSCVSEYFYNVAVARNDKGATLQSKDMRRAADSPACPSADALEEWFRSHGVEAVDITSFDGLKLRGWYVPAASPSARTVILAHGYSGRGFNMARIAAWYRDQLGWNVLAPDARGHGDSGGTYIGFGWHERRDYVAWANWLVARLGPESRVALHGISMGGATVMMASGEADLPPQVKAVVEDCGYSSVYAQLAWRLERDYGLPAEPIVGDTSRLTRQRAGWDFREASAKDQVAKTRLPILFIHGEADQFVPSAMVHELYAAAAGPKELWTVPGAGHGQSWSVDQAGYTARVQAFLARYMDERAVESSLPGSP